jgi:branched-subunit amino acid ABC-type transport system permease component
MEYQHAIGFCIIILVLLLRPSGLFSKREGA